MKLTIRILLTIMFVTVLCTELSVASRQTASRPHPVFAGQYIRLAGIEFLPVTGWALSQKIPSDFRHATATFTSFDGKYERGGTIPEGGAEITIFADGDVADLSRTPALIDHDLVGVVRMPPKTIKVAGFDGTQIDYDATFGKVTYKNSVVYLPLKHKGGPVLYKFFLTVNTAEQVKTESYRTSFQSILNSAKVVAPVNQ